MIYETRKEPVEVQYYETEAVTRTVRRPVTRKVYVPYNTTVMVPRQVVQRTPLSYYDPFSPAIASGYSSFSPPISSSTISSSSIICEPEVAAPSLSPAESFSDKPRTSMKTVIEDSGEQPEPKPDPEPNKEGDGPLELNPADPADQEDIPQPAIDDTNATEAGWRIRWNPSLAREA